jgi:hypothetical protein
MTNLHCLLSTLVNHGDCSKCTTCKISFNPVTTHWVRTTHYPHFREEAMETQTGEVTCPRSQSVDSDLQGRGNIKPCALETHIPGMALELNREKCCRVSARMEGSSVQPGPEGEKVFARQGMPSSCVDGGAALAHLEGKPHCELSSPVDAEGKSRDGIQIPLPGGASCFPACTCLAAA